jgi:prepilin-type N-terminal cleavage/methylation domain-containing protein
MKRLHLLFKKKEKINAFTLIEVMVAMLVLAIGLLGLAGITVVVLKSNTLSQQISEATTIAADLMDTLKRQSLTALPDCTTASVVPLSTAQGSSCATLSESGVAALPLQSGANIYLPSTSNVTCGMAGVLDTSATAMTFNYIAANLMVFSPAPTGAATVCNESSSTTPSRSYLRYFRSFVPTGSTTDKTIVVVVLWKDKYNRWRNVHLSTTRTN